MNQNNKTISDDPRWMWTQLIPGFQPKTETAGNSLFHPSYQFYKFELLKLVTRVKSWDFGGIGCWWSKERITWKKSSLRSAKSRTTCLHARRDTYITLRNRATSAQRWSLLYAKLSIKTMLFNLPHAVFLLQLSNYYVDTRYDERKFDIFLIFIYILPSVNLNHLAMIHFPRLKVIWKVVVGFVWREVIHLVCRMKGHCCCLYWWKSTSDHSLHITSH